LDHVQVFLLVVYNVGYVLGKQISLCLPCVSKSNKSVNLSCHSGFLTVDCLDKTWNSAAPVYPSFGCLKRRPISSNSEPDLITIPLFFMVEPYESTELISIAKDASLPLESGSLNRNIPGILVASLSQFLPLMRICLRFYLLLLSRNVTNVEEVNL
jgi:hypothetical protein